MSEQELADKSNSKEGQSFDGESKGSIWAGLGLTLTLHFVAQVATVFILGAIMSGERGLYLTFLPVMYIGVSQLVYMIPAILILVANAKLKPPRV